MPKLTVDFSDALVDLFKKGSVFIHGVEVGPWFSPGAIKGFQEVLPGVPFYFHASSIVSRIKVSKKGIIRLQEYLTCTQSPWLSLHIELLPWYIFLLSKNLKIHLSPPEAKQATRQFIEVLKRVKKVIDLPIVLENLPSLPLEKYSYAASPELITHIVEETDSGLLLDIAHSRIAATFQRIDVKAYIERLPLDRVKQIHISGIRMKDGHFYDAHESLEEQDYELLKWVLEKSKPEIVTLEYFRERKMLREQLLRLREIVTD
jgi:uncharacterized protein (UPF0276 family)